MAVGNSHVTLDAERRVQSLGLPLDDHHSAFMGSWVKTTVIPCVDWCRIPWFFPSLPTSHDSFQEQAMFFLHPDHGALFYLCFNSSLWLVCSFVIKEPIRVQIPQEGPHLWTSYPRLGSMPFSSSSSVLFPTIGLSWFIDAFYLVASFC